MITIYLKSPDERIVVSLRGKNPKLDDWYKRKGYVQIEWKEFRRIKARILRNFKGAQSRLDHHFTKGVSNVNRRNYQENVV